MLFTAYTGLDIGKANQESALACCYWATDGLVTLRTATATTNVHEESGIAHSQNLLDNG